MNQPQTEFDTPWKDILQEYFADFMQFFFPQAHEEIEWTLTPEFLDKELQQVVRDAELGRRLVDKLVKIYLTGGEETWLLIHIEVQSQEEINFAQRMFVYNYRIYDRYKRSVASLAVLGDEQSNWRSAASISAEPMIMPNAPATRARWGRWNCNTRCPPAWSAPARR